MSVDSSTDEGVEESVEEEDEDDIEDLEDEGGDDEDDVDSAQDAIRSAAEQGQGSTLFRASAASCLVWSWEDHLSSQGAAIC